MRPLRVESEVVAGAGAVTPHLAAAFRYGSLPARPVPRRCRLRLGYFEGVGLGPISVAAIRQAAREVSMPD